MTYKNFVTKKEVLIEEFGVEKLTRRLIVSPIEWDRVFPKDWLKRLRKEGFKIEGFVSKDRHLSKIEKNYLINRTLFLFLGRGLTEFVDRAYILVRNPKVKEIIFVGSAASLVDFLDSGDVNIPKFALPWENISSNYVDVSEAVPKANEELLKKVTQIGRKIANKLGINIGNYNHVTIDLYYEETEELLKYFREFNIATIDMELSSLYRLGKYFGKKVIGILRVGDRPLHKEQFWSEKHKRKRKRKERGKDVVFRIVKSLIR